MTDSSAAAGGYRISRSSPSPIDVSLDALFLDIDGTLAPLELHPDHVGPEPRRTAVLRALHDKLDGRLAVVTGRTIEDADRILDATCEVVAGVHGLTIRCPGGELNQTAPSPILDWALTQATLFAADRPGVLVENKGAGLTLHYRQAPEHAEDVIAFGQFLARRTRLRGQPGDMVFEVREAQADKGTAVEALMRMAPFRGYRPIFVGDDLTDEDGMRAAEALEGFGILVGDRAESVARYRLANVDAVLDWLEAAL